MAARARRMVANVPTSSQRQQISSDLPEYQPAQFTLSREAQRALHELSISSRGLTKLEEDLREAIAILTNKATDINERLVTRTGERAAKRAKRERNRADPDDEEAEEAAFDEEAELEKQRAHEEKVDSLTERLDASVRKMIDVQHGVTFLKAGVKEASTFANHHASTQATLAAQSQHRQPTPADRDGDSDEEDVNEEYSEINPTAPVEATQTIIGPYVIFKDYVAKQQEIYRDTSQADRYSHTVAYTGFKKMVHEAKHSVDNLEAPPATEWFKEKAPAAPGITATGDGDNDDNDDIQMTRATTSTKCPITLQEFREPLSSNKCPHSFEASAIRELISNANRGGADRRGVLRPVQCPVQGCSQMLTLADLHQDPFIMRRIQRLQRARQREREMQDLDGSNAGNSIGAVIVDEDGDDNGLDIDDIEDDDMPATSNRVKYEMRSSMRP